MTNLAQGMRKIFDECDACGDEEEGGRARG